MLSADLVSAAREGRLVLFLGAGASRGASDGAREIPDGPQLAAAIVDRYLLPAHRGLGLTEAYELACSRRSIRELQKFLHDTLFPFQPTPAHLLIPNIAWAGIVTTNYDLLVERAYFSAGRSTDLAVFARDGSRPLDSVPREKTIYLKLHGCVTEFEDVDVPLITSTEQIIDHRNHRANLFKTFLEWGQNHHMAIVGYGLKDDNLRSLIQQLINEGDRRPRHYLVRPTWDEVLSDFWRERRFETVSADMATFAADLVDSLPRGGTDLGRLAKAQRVTSFTRFISHSGASESDHLVDALGTVFEHVDAMPTTPGSAQAFYSGVNQEWFPIESQLDVRRSLENHVLRRCILRPPEKRPQLFLIKGHAGSGKSVLLRRIAWEAAKHYERLTLFLRSGQQIDVKALEEIEGLTNVPVYLFVDDVGEHVDDIRHLLERATVREWRLIIIGAERVNEWNMTEGDSGVVPDGEFSLEYLGRTEIDDLLVLLEAHQSLGELAKLPLEARVEALSERAGRQLLVALHEATKGASFDDILESEYEGITPLEAKALYLDICALHRFGPPVRAGLISRIHGISFDEFEHRFYKPLESVVLTTRDRYTGDFVYSARHNYIAETVFYRAAKTEALRQEILLRIIDKINLDFSYDEVVFYELVKARSLAELFPGRRFGEPIYEAAARAAGRTPRLLHQWGLYQLRVAAGREDLDRAEGYIREALAAEPESRSLRHTLAELALRRSEVARTDLEAVALRQQAAAIARKLATNSSNSHPQHTLAKVALATLNQALAEDRARPSELTTQALNQAIQEAESSIRLGLNRFPNDPYLLTAEAELAAKVKNAGRALSAMRRAFAQNPKSELVANRLALLHEAGGDFPTALHVLQTGLSHNPGSAVLNLRYALVRMASEPGIDVEQPELILHHLKRSYQRGRANISSQYWYARQLYLAGREREGHSIFELMAKEKMPSDVRDRERGVVLQADGAPRRFYGEIAFLEALYGLISQTSPAMKVYFRRAGPLLDAKEMTLGRKVAYKLGFNTRGPVAIEVEVVS